MKLANAVRKIHGQKILFTIHSICSLTGHGGGQIHCNLPFQLHETKKDEKPPRRVCGYLDSLGSKHCGGITSDNIHKRRLLWKLRVKSIFKDQTRNFRWPLRQSNKTAEFNSLFGLGIRGRLLRWLRSFLCNRRARVRLGSCVSDWYDVENGLVQGSVLSPVLFSLWINDLPGNLISKTALYADDCAMWESGTEMEQYVNHCKVI